MTRTLTTTDVEPDDKTSWRTPDGDFAFVRADRAKASKGEKRWYCLETDGEGGWVVGEPFPWSQVDGPDYDPDSWPLTEGGRELHDLVMREVGQ